MAQISPVNHSSWLCNGDDCKLLYKSKFCNHRSFEHLLFVFLFLFSLPSFGSFLVSFPFQTPLSFLISLFGLTSCFSFCAHISAWLCMQYNTAHYFVKHIKHEYLPVLQNACIFTWSALFHVCLNHVVTSTFLSLKDNAWLDCWHVRKEKKPTEATG